MKITHITVDKKEDYTLFSADFIFSKPVGGKKNKVRFFFELLASCVLHPIQSMKSGPTVTKTIWYKVPNDIAREEGKEDAFFYLALPLALAIGEDLSLEGEVSEKLLKKVPAIKKYYHEIVTKDIRIFAQKKKTTLKKYSEVGQFFTLGVDSFYTLACLWPPHEKKKRSLLYVDGYDVPLSQQEFLRMIHDHLRIVASKTESKSVIVETNLRTLTDTIIGWGRYHVSALAACGILTHFQKLLISGESFESPDWGLRSGVDILLSTPYITFQLAAHNIERDIKIKKVLQSQDRELFLQNVRVCWENVRLTPIPYNCGVCQKCLKTKLTLLTLSVSKTPTFPQVDVNKLRQIHLVGHVYTEWQHLYKNLQKMPKIDADILDAVDSVLKKPLRV